MSKFRRSVLATLMISSCLTAGAARAQLIGDPSTYRTDEYWRSWGLAMIDADWAYAQGVDGAGVKIGVVDGGVEATTPELVGQVAGGFDYVTGRAELVDPTHHGTAVAAFIVGRRDGVGTHGVAPGAQVVSARIFDDEGGLEDDAAIVGQAWSDLLDQGVRIINNSWGLVDEPATGYTAADVVRKWPRMVAAAQSAVERGALMIFITHNGAMDEANVEAAYPYYFPELERGWLAVTAVGASGEIASYANTCGVAMNWCLAAVGGDGEADGFGLPAVQPDGSVVGLDGTSYAAPQVAGVAALVWQMYPYFTTDQVRQTLLGTAIDIGAPGVDAVYGYGLLNAGNAVAGPGRFDWGDFDVDQPAGYSEWSNDIGGDGGLVKQGAGTLVLYGRSDYAGETRVLDGVLAVQGSIASDAFVGERGALAGNGIVYGNVRSEGRVLAGNASDVGLLTIDGDLELARTSRVVAGFAPGGLTNGIEVTGALRIEGGVLEARLAPGLYREGYTETLIDAGGGTSGVFAGLEGQVSAFLSTAVSYEAGAVNLTLNRLAFDDASVCEGANQCAVAGAFERGLDLGDQGFLAGAASLQHASVSEARRGFASLSGQAYASMATLSLSGDGGLERSLGNRLDRTDQPGVWMSAQGGWGRLGGGRETSGADHHHAGLGAGRDWRLTANLIGGVSLGYDEFTAEFDQFATRGEVKAYEAAAYGRYAQGRFAASGWLSYAQLSNSLQRRIEIADQASTAQSKYDAGRAAAFGEVSYGYDLAWATLSPVASLRYGRLEQDSFVEQGGDGLGLAARDMTLESWRVGAGVRAEAAFKTERSSTQVEARALWLREFGDGRAKLDAAFTGAPGIGFASYGAEPDRDSLALGLAVNTAVGRRAALFANIDARLGERESAQTAEAGVRFSW